MSTIVEIQLPDAQATLALGAAMAGLVERSALIGLIGPLGAGKTTFAKGVAQALGVQEVVSSPTFTMLNEYASGRIPLYHLDLYRLREDPDSEDSASPAAFAMVESELDEIQSSSGLVLIEWSNFFDEYMRQQDYVVVELNYSTPAPSATNADARQAESGRNARVRAHGKRSLEIVERLGNIYFS